MIDSRKTIAELEEKLAVARAKERAWRDAFHALRGSVEDRLDRATEQLKKWEAIE